jgi:hypothetical protein
MPLPSGFDVSEPLPPSTALRPGRLAGHDVNRAARTDNPSVAPALGLGVYIITGMFYFFPPGSPQPAEAFLLAVATVAPILFGLRIPREPLLYSVLSLFLAWTALVNVVWFILEGDVGFLWKTSFYLYDTIIFVFVVAVGLQAPGVLRAVVRCACLVALPAQLAYVVLIHFSEGWRATGSFNNPNQLAYWALLTMASLCVVKGRIRLGVMEVAVLCSGLYLVASSVSRSGLIAALLLILSILLCCGVRRSAGISLAVVLLLGLMFELSRGDLVTRIMQTDVVSVLDMRLSRTGEYRHDSLSARGYIRLFNNPQHLVFGAGEGAYARLNPDTNQPLSEANKEFHSTLGNIFMSYGLIGLGVFSVFLLVVFSRASWFSYAYFCPIMIYGVTHMGLRETMFWIFLALVYVQSRSAQSDAKIGAPASSPSVRPRFEPVREASGVARGDDATKTHPAGRGLANLGQYSQ